MRRAATILIGILLGALATGLGIGLVLHQANADRTRLAEAVATTVHEASTAREENRRAIEEANRKLQEANAEVAKAQQLISDVKDEQRYLATAQILRPQTGKTLYGWTTVVALDLGVTLKQPPSSMIATNSSHALSLIRTAYQADPRWLTLKPYNAKEEQELLQTIPTSTTVAYNIDNHLLLGARGIPTGQEQVVLILRVQNGGNRTHLLWIRDPNGNAAISTNVLQVLSSLRFER